MYKHVWLFFAYRVMRSLIIHLIDAPLIKCITHVFFFYAANTVNYNFWKCFFWKAGDYQMVLQMVMVLFDNIPLLMKINTSNRYRIINVKVLVLSTSNSLWKYTFTLNDF